MFNKTILIATVLFFSGHLLAQKSSNIFIIPEPVTIKGGNGGFDIKKGVTIQLINVNDSVKKIATDFAARFLKVTGLPLKMNMAKVPIKGSIVFAKSTVKIPVAEGYELHVNQDNIKIAANDAAGYFYAVQSLYQLLPPEFFSIKPQYNKKWVARSVSITDYPRFKWRGLMLDVARHFFTKDEVKRFIDEMVVYKYNILHLHLTDDEGWRVEIKTLPKLTEVGAWRGEQKGKWANTKTIDPNEPKTYGGFYTHDDIRELVKYAAERFVNIMPEIDAPGHSRAAAASYPQLSCSEGPHTVFDGTRNINWPVAVVDNTLCPANEFTYEFFDKVFTEVAMLFPFEYIHTGGDECSKNFWLANDGVKALMKKENLKDGHEVQSYFSRRLAKIVESKGKKFMGWNEIIDGGAPPSAAVMAYRSEDWGTKASQLGHKTIMTPLEYTYLDYFQGDSLIDPPIYDKLRLNQTYKFDPVPTGAIAENILGGQGNLWTEQVPNYRTVQFMIWPRALSLAESLWSPKENKNWEKFAQKVETNMERFDAANIKYSRSMFEAVIEAKRDRDGRLMPVISTEIPGIDIYYSIDESSPDEYYQKYTKPFSLAEEVANIKVVTYRNGKQIGRQINVPVTELAKRVID